MDNYIKTNKAAWESRTAIHIKSDFYNFEGFMQGESSIPSLDYKLLGSLADKSLLHLQCHFGMDTLSIARGGTARTVGVDFSESAIAKARELNIGLGLNAEFICSDIYKLPEMLDEQFDIVYTSYGVIDWLKDLDEWAKIIDRCLRPGGRFVMVEFHPMLWMFGEDLKTIEYAYFREEPYIQTEGTYTGDGEGVVSETVNWTHGVAEPVNALLKTGLRIESFTEYFHSPVNLFGRMIQTGDMEYKLKGYEDIVPLLYSVTAKKI